MSPISTKLGQDIPRHIWKRYEEGFWVGTSSNRESTDPKLELFILQLRFQWNLLVKVKKWLNIWPSTKKHRDMPSLPLCVVNGIWSNCSVPVSICRTAAFPTARIRSFLPQLFYQLILYFRSIASLIVASFQTIWRQSLSPALPSGCHRR